MATAALANRLAGATMALVLHESATEALTEVAFPNSGELVVAVGPEGGISDRELAQLSGVGAFLVRLGPEVLRSSTAGAAALTVINAKTRWT